MVHGRRYSRRPCLALTPVRHKQHQLLPFLKAIQRLLAKSCSWHLKDNHRIIVWCRLERTLESPTSNPQPQQGCTRLPEPHPAWPDCLQDGAPPTSLGNLLKPPCVPPLSDHGKSPSSSCLYAPFKATMRSPQRREKT